MMPRSAQSSLSHWTTTRPGMEAGSSGTTESSWPWQTTMPPECWPRWRGRSCRPVRVRGSVWTREVVELEACFVEAAIGDLRRGCDQPQPRGEAGDLVECLHVEAEDLADFARGEAAAVGDDVGGHGGAALAVALVDVLDDAFALFAAGEVDIDVGPLAALFGEEALEQQVHADGVDGGDAERVADGAVGGGAASLAEDALLAAETDDVPDDQEVAAEVELFDEREFALNLPAGAFVIGLVAPARAFFGALQQERGDGFAGRERGSAGTRSRGRRA